MKLLTSYFLKVEDVVSRATDGETSTIHDLDFSSLCSQLGLLAARLCEIDGDTESEVDDIVGSSSVSTALPDASGQDGAATEPWDDSSKSDVAELDTSVFLSFEWTNGEPYEIAVQRYCSSVLFQNSFKWTITCSLLQLTLLL
ncbi:hypothetical protein CerSpe_245980 [Prunus speciosa]